MKRKEIVKTINNLRGTEGHKIVLDIYNDKKPLPRGYEVKYSDAWCATTVSSVFLLHGCEDFRECSCIQMVEKAKQKGLWMEKDKYRPKIGDVVLYDWQDSGQGDNQGAPDHVGIVTKTTDSTFTVREGNFKGGIGERTMLYNAKYIRGFILPTYDQESAKQKKSNEVIAEEVIAGKWGTGEARKTSLKDAGYSYSKIQRIVNQKMKGEKK